MAKMPKSSDDADAIAARIVKETNGDIRLALPLGLGKANTIVNALTKRVLADTSIRLQIFTALTLEVPKPTSDMQKRFLAPAMDRLFGDFTPLDYAALQRSGTLPDNITVQEFFFQAGNWLNNPAAQQEYITANYTHALFYLMDRKPNVIAQLLGRVGDRFSLACNTDITVDLLRARHDGTQDFLMVGEVNEQLPFMAGSGEIQNTEIDLLLDDPQTQFELFSAPKRPVGLDDHAIGLHVSSLIRDGGTLQVGIGSIGDAVAAALLLRHQKYDVWQEIRTADPFNTSRQQRETGPFDQGLYAVTEMLVQGILKLLQGGVIKRHVDGAAIHAGFFLDCRDFYRELREMTEDDRARIAMMPVSFTNQLYGDEMKKRAARIEARFVNAAMKVTALGGVVSDITHDGRIVSGVGGQYNFIDQAFALKDARAIITLPATRTSKGRVTSNIVWDHPHETIPRHLRDIIVTEYGIADLRGCSDADAILAMIAIADDRFQKDLLDQAKSVGKLPANAVVPEGHRQNTPLQLEEWLKPFHNTGVLVPFPFGTDFTDVEQRLLSALTVLKAANGSYARMATLIWRGLITQPDNLERDGLERMALEAPRTPKSFFTAAILRGAMYETRNSC